MKAGAYAAAGRNFNHRDGRAVGAVRRCCRVENAEMGGGYTCGTWTEARQSNSPERTALSNWVIGYVNGVNMRESQQDILLRTDPNAIVAWMDNYCGAHPLDQVWTGAFHLVKELEGRAIPEN